MAKSASIEEFNDLIDNTPLAAWAVDKKGKLLAIKGGMFSRSQEKDLQKLIGLSVFTPEFTREDARIGEYHQRAIDGETFIASATFAGHVYEVHFAPYKKKDKIVGAVALATDVTVCRMAQEEHEMLASLIHSSNDAIIAQTVTGTIVSWNPAAERTYGYTVAEAVGKSIAMIIPTGKEKEFQNVMEQIRAGKSLPSFETLQSRKDGTLLNVAVTVSPIRNEKGEVNGASVISRDISREWWLKREKDAIIFIDKAVAMAKTFEEVFLQLPTMLATRLRFPIVTIETVDENAQSTTLVGSHGIDAKGMSTARPIASSNSACIDALLTGNPVYEVGTGRVLQYLVPSPVRIDANTCICLPVVAGGTVRAIVTLASREPMYIDPILREVLPVIAGELGRQMAFWEDEAKLRKSEGRYRLISEYSSDVILQTSAAGVVSYVSPSVTTVLGWTPEEFVERSAYEFIHADDIESAQRYHAELFASPGAHTGTYRLQNKKGTYVWVEVHASAIRNAQGEVSEIIASFRDVTNRMEADKNAQTAHRSEVGVLRSALLIETQERMRLVREVEELKKSKRASK